MMIDLTKYYKKGPVVGCLIAVMLGVSMSIVRGETDQAKQTRLQNIRQQLEQTRSEYQKMSRQEQSLLGELNVLEQTLEENRRQLQIYQDDLAQNQDELRTIKNNLEQLQLHHTHKKTTLHKRLRAIYKMGDLGYLAPIFAMSSYHDIQQQIKYLQLISESDVSLLETVEKDMQAIREEQEALRQREQAILQAQEEINAQQAKMEAQQQQKDQLLQQIRRDKTQFTLAMQRLETSAQRLDQLLRAEPQDPTPRPTSRQESGPTITFPDDQQAVIKSYDPKYFRSNKGKLLWPVQGRIITPYGQITIGGSKTFYKGVDIEANKGTPFYSVFKGTVKYADWFEGRGNLIIVDHGGNYYTIYAHADELAVKPGDEVDTRQVLGKVGDTDSFKGSHLYFEVRANGKPEDPRRWLAKLR